MNHRSLACRLLSISRFHDCIATDASFAAEDLMADMDRRDNNLDRADHFRDARPCANFGRKVLSSVDHSIREIATARKRGQLALFYRHRLCQVARLVHVGALQDGNVVSKQLQRDCIKDRCL